MKEEYLHYAFDKRMLGNEFFTAIGKKLEVLDFGELNTDAGPDFLDARIKYDDKIWVGPIEFHLKASDWYKHHHQKDPAYQNVIAHFVMENDQDVFSGKQLLPTVIIKELIDQNHHKQYEHLIANNHKIPCAPFIKQLNSSVIEQEKERQLKRRLWEKSLVFLEDLERLNGDRTKAYQLQLARILGGKANQLPFLALVEAIDFRWLRKLNFNAFKIEALLLGVAGLLPEKCHDNYEKALKEEFDYLRHLFDIKQNIQLIWKYSRMRPYAFPDRRVVLYAQLLAKQSVFPPKLPLNLTKSEINNRITVNLNEYWSNHYRLGKVAQANQPVNLSNTLKNLIVINAIVPYAYAIGAIEGNEVYKQKAIELLKQIPAEQNKIIKTWQNVGVKAKNAFDTQALIQLQKAGCNQKKCLFCNLGKNVLKK